MRHGPRCARLAGGLTQLEEDFAQAFISTHGRSSDAYRIAYIDRPGRKKPSVMKKNVIAVKARETLLRPLVAARIMELREQVASKVVTSEARLLQEQTRLALSDIREILHPDGTIRPHEEWPEDVAAAVSGIDFTPDGRVAKVRLWNKIDAIDMLNKHLGLYEKDNAQAAQGLSIVIYDYERRP